MKKVLVYAREQKMVLANFYDVKQNINCNFLFTLQIKHYNPHLSFKRFKTKNLPGGSRSWQRSCRVKVEMALMCKLTPSFKTD
jgi:hypothetical protein